MEWVVDMQGLLKGLKEVISIISKPVFGQVVFVQIGGVGQPRTASHVQTTGRKSLWRQGIAPIIISVGELFCLL